MEESYINNDIVGHTIETELRPRRGIKTSRRGQGRILDHFKCLLPAGDCIESEVRNCYLCIALYKASALLDHVATGPRR